MNLAHTERRSALFLPLALLAALLAALALAVAALVITLTDDDGTTFVREVSVTPAAEVPAHFSERPDESAVAAAVGRAASRETASPFPGLSAQAEQAGINPAGQQDGTSHSPVEPNAIHEPGQGYRFAQPRYDGGPEEGTAARAISP
jgi:hypothetical protein